MIFRVAAAAAELFGVVAIVAFSYDVVSAFAGADDVQSGDDDPGLPKNEIAEEADGHTQQIPQVFAMGALVSQDLLGTQPPKSR